MSCAHCGDGHAEATKCPRTGKPLAEPGPCGTTIDRYEIVTLLSSGGFGAVYRGRHIHTRRAVAVKLLDATLASDPAMVVRFKREAQVLAAIESPHVVEVFDWGVRPTGEAYLVMELLQGRDLHAVGRVSRDRALSIAGQLLAALRVVHAANIVHRDLKPTNVFVDSSSTVKLIDFGISKQVAIAGDPFRTAAGRTFGSAGYMAPEQIRSSSVDARADIYGAGVVIYELLAGRLPFLHDSYEDYVVRVCTEEPPEITELVPDLPPAIAKAVMRAIAREPGARWQRVDDFARALTEPARADAPTMPEPVRPAAPTVSEPARANAPTVPDARATTPTVPEARANGPTVHDPARADGPIVHERVNATNVFARADVPTVPEARANAPTVSEAGAHLPTVSEAGAQVSEAGAHSPAVRDRGNAPKVLAGVDVPTVPERPASTRRAPSRAHFLLGAVVGLGLIGGVAWWALRGPNAPDVAPVAIVEPAHDAAPAVTVADAVAAVEVVVHDDATVAHDAAVVADVAVVVDATVVAPAKPTKQATTIGWLNARLQRLDCYHPTECPPLKCTCRGGVTEIGSTCAGATCASVEGTCGAACGKSGGWAGGVVEGVLTGHARRDRDCAVSSVCASAGRCIARQGECVKASCSETTSCKTLGLCGDEGGDCQPSDDGCARSDVCRNRGECARGANRCAALTDDGCRASKACSSDGLCVAKAGHCVIGSERDCASSAACTSDGRCKWAPGYSTCNR